MKKIITLLLILFSIVLNSCATFLSPKTQEVTIKSDEYSMKVHVNGELIAEGKQVTTRVKKDANVKQVVLEVDGYKKEYTVLVQNKRSGLYALSWIPFGALFLIPPLSDQGVNGWNYEKEFVFNDFIKYTKWDKSMKNIYIGDIEYKVAKQNQTYAINSYSNFLKNKPPSPRKVHTLDTIKYGTRIYRKDLYEVLKRNNFIDTTTIFHDNLNTLILNCTIDKFAINEYRRFLNSISFSTELVMISFIQIDLKSIWSVTDIYGDEIFIDTSNHTSGLFSVDYFKKDPAITLAIGDALEVSMLNLLNKPEFQKILQFEEPTKIQFEKLVLNTPAKTPKNVEESMQATLTIKTEGSHGSGFLISNDGYIITNHHVINKKDKEFTAVTSNGIEYSAKVIRTNKNLDLALLKIDGDFEYAFKLPEKENYKIGQIAYAIGTPQSIELGQSVTRGVISNIRNYRNYNYIQSDVSINRGNSGGPMISENGSLIAIVEWKIGGIGTEGISFSIPAKDVLDALEISY